MKNYFGEEFLPLSDCEMSIDKHLISFINFDLPIIYYEVFNGLPIKSRWKDSVLGTLNLVLIPDNQIGLSLDLIIGSNYYIIILGQLSADIIQKLFSELSSDKVTNLILLFGVKSAIKITFKISHRKRLLNRASLLTGSCE